MPAVLITGAARGIGRATALRLAAAGWDVLAGVRDPDHGAALIAQPGGARIAPVVLDVTDAQQIEALASALPARLDAVVNNAGVVVAGPVEGVRLDDLRRAALAPEHRALYAKHLAAYRRSIPRSRKLAGPVDAVAAAVERALTARRPRARYVVGAGPTAQAILAQVTPTPLLDRALRAAIGVPRKL